MEVLHTVLTEEKEGSTPGTFLEVLQHRTSKKPLITVDVDVFKVCIWCVQVHFKNVCMNVFSVVSFVTFPSPLFRFPFLEL